MKRHLDKQLSKHFDRYKQVMVLLGSRQIGKTTILQKFFPQAEYFLIDNEPIKKIFETYDIQAYKTLKNLKKILIKSVKFIK
jgi:predicted AAA+ superfamily ATPase